MSKQEVIGPDLIKSKIYVMRGKQVMLDRDLAVLYEVETKYLKRQVRRNIERFPEDFMFELNKSEYDILRRQNVTLKKGSGKHSKYLPYAFTEQGVAMLSSVLNSKRAIQVNIQIMRAFTNLRSMLDNCGNLKRKIKNMEAKYDKNFKVVFDAIKQLLTMPKQKNRIIKGFREK